MLIDRNLHKPIFVQVIDEIEDAILTGVFIEEKQILSTTELSILYNISKGTIQRGFSKLIDDGTIYKKRGIGMFVAKGANNRLLIKRKEDFFENYIIVMIVEAKRLDIDRSEIKQMKENKF